MILDKIIRYKKNKVKEEKVAVPLGEIMKQIEDMEEARNFKAALVGRESISMIAEVKKASPSKGIIKKDFNPVKIAAEYEKNRVDAISVLTEDQFFLGDNRYLQDIRKMTTIPLLRKDFMIDAYQIYQSKALGADAILLIAAALTKKEMIAFQKIAAEIGIYSLVEVHNKEELEMILETGAEIIGINNRDLKTFDTTLDRTAELLPFIPKDKIVVSESGIKTNQDMKLLKNYGINAVLMGEGLMRADSIGEKLRELRSGLCD
ncbi:Indole-3-glycerol-phosphate synthase [Alkaliphilus metalliredigens QYMF]|uniref:Indole-3-glycerol phosphate synthase n=1 Tax=Alkaliphilus metalliredigens (strain QYMF) TaxID=293826 RepID=TRPC_ALKMQ|nr:indole-3-glycerol phosphate synthase TrpC [Alkaliphilus metalliredigens]A6TM74.1 RecName: Full=Indole-3-glycerol phosphate synthase; Short=IGPS [Alkaliphilus metalliredigens QYMF]ABR47292.1 Indole-3-glycerol-phosphate synthase [Alkaliphilus metalliredigens QYMF]